MAYNPSTNIVVSGKTFMDVPAVQFKTPDGAMVNFAHVGGSIRFSPTLEEQTNNVENFSNAIIDPITSTLLNQLDSDFVAENIKKDVDLFGLVGTMEGGEGSSWTDNYSVFATGTFTPTEKVTEWSIDTGVPYSYHDSNNKLNYLQQSLILWREPDGNSLNGLVVATLRSYSKQYPDYNGGALGSLAGTAAKLFYRKKTNAFPQEGETIWKIDGNSDIAFMAGRPYRWILLGVLK